MLNKDETKSGRQSPSPYGRDQNMYDNDELNGDLYMHHIQSRVPSSVDVIGSSTGGAGVANTTGRLSFSASGRNNKTKNPTLDFAADGYVMTSDGY
jgi:hypothetical protein